MSGAFPFPPLPKPRRQRGFCIPGPAQKALQITLRMHFINLRGGRAGASVLDSPADPAKGAP